MNAKPHGGEDDPADNTHNHQPIPQPSSRGPQRGNFNRRVDRWFAGLKMLEDTAGKCMKLGFHIIVAILMFGSTGILLMLFAKWVWEQVSRGVA